MLNFLNFNYQTLHNSGNLCNFGFDKRITTTMKRNYIYLFGILPVMMLSACSGNKHDKDDDALADSLINADSIINVADTTPQEPPKLIISGAEAQMKYMKDSENWKKYESGILPQMTQDAPEYVQKIFETEGKRFIIVDKAKMKLFLYDPYGNVEKSYGIACAMNYGTKQRKGDSRTTEGFHYVKGVFDSTNWLYTNDAGYTSPTRGVYGPRFIRLNIPYIGIHGTGSAGSIGRRVSHGCIRLTNDNIMELVKYVEEGMPVIISPGPKDIAVNEKDGYKILAVATEPGTPRAQKGDAPYIAPIYEKLRKPGDPEPAAQESETPEPSEGGNAAPEEHSEPAPAAPASAPAETPAAIEA